MGGYCLNVGYQSSDGRHDFVRGWYRRLGRQHGVLVKLGRIWGPAKSYERIGQFRNSLGPLALIASGLRVSYLNANDLTRRLLLR
jgi:hypothetical protein